MTTSTPDTIPRRYDLDALRAVAMLLGIVLHSALSFTPLSFPWVVQDTRQNEVFALFFFAIHGFRMPVFFLMSGFFSAMLWRKRGLKALVRQRFRRVFLPLLLGLVTIVPAVNWISGVAIRSASRPGAESEIWTAAKVGALNAIEQHLANGVDVNGLDGQAGLTPLSWAALGGQMSAVELLLENGAKVNTSDEKSTPLHAAAFLGHTEIVDLLLQNGADVNAKNDNGETPLDAVMIDMAITQFVAAFVGIEIDETAVERGRGDSETLLRQHGAQLSRELPGVRGSREKTASRLWSWLTQSPLFAHLWFLWHLCWLVAGFALIAMIADRLPRVKLPAWLVLSPARYLWLVPLTMIPQAFMGDGGRIPSFGPDTSLGIVPIPHVLAYYALFFGFGALYFGYEDHAGRINKWWWLALPVGLVIMLPVGLVFTFDDTLLSHEIRRLLSIFAQAAFPWVMAFGLIGLFRKLLANENRAMRYLSDSSYWLYLAHLPLIIGAQIVLREWQLPAGVKFVLICVVVTAFLLLVYQTLVRYRWLGTFLNGRRQRPLKIVQHAAD